MGMLSWLTAHFVFRRVTGLQDCSIKLQHININLLCGKCRLYGAPPVPANSQQLILARRSHLARARYL